ASVASFKMRTICGPVAEGIAMSTLLMACLCTSAPSASPLANTRSPCKVSPTLLESSSTMPLTSHIRDGFCRSSHRSASPAAPAPYMSVLVRSPSALLLLLAVTTTRIANLPPKVSNQEISQSRMYTERGMPQGPSRMNMTNPPSIDPPEAAKTSRTASYTEVCRQLPRLTAPTMKAVDFAPAQMHRA